MKIYINVKCHYKHVYLVYTHIFQPIMFYVIILQNKHLDLKKNYAFTQASEGNKKKSINHNHGRFYIRPPLNFATEFFSNRW